MDVKQLESRCKEVSQNLRMAADDKHTSELLQIIHRPGWTTPAEMLLVNGYLDSINSHAKLITNLKETLLAGARAVAPK